MKTCILIFILVCSKSIFAQKTLDTIYANDKKNVALFFPSQIRQGITGADHFVFTYNREKEQYFGLLQAKPGNESNLLTVTNDGKIYSYILKYAEQLSKLNYFVAEDESIGIEIPQIKLRKTENKIVSTYTDRKPYFQRAAEYLLKSIDIPIATKRKKRIQLQLKKMIYDASEVYLVIEVKNKSGIDFEIDYLNIYRTSGNSKRKASFQRLRQEVVYKHVMPSAISNRQAKKFVYVLPKFVLGDNEKLMLELKELKGSRKVILETKI
ncbi:DUF4138 domain-containing protein [uncultured Lutibacter sp.]|uniref:DUF4138 domain-containing protein n=1 Tax=uncultured Lutibacter sp. TaxID=437739 RepID=UPI00260342ED|nr:DUF4138 domain-containing protein [uncultured Lutibacter sp.]